MGISDYDDLDRLEKVISEYGSIEELTSAIHDIAINESVGFDMDDFIDYLECDRAYICIIILIYPVLNGEIYY